MKNKTLVIMGAIVIVAVLGAVLFFVLHGGEKQPAETVSLEGTWLIFQHGETSPRDEYLVFSDNDVSYYIDGDNNPAAASTYSINDDTLSTPDINKTFSIRSISENHVELVEPNTIVWRLLLVGDPDVDRTTIVPESVEGVYDVMVVGEEKRYDETISFTDSHMSLVQDGKETVSSDFIIDEDGMLQLTTINRSFYVYMNGSVLLFINPDDNCVWELNRAK